ncbi:5630_t:CDS:2 [Diversispora eburnea]|uniref:Origin recognition complex subunit 4 n=1 Tax=Diversispora eburnea TaxID=1213867 RepID=A0A9N9FFL5_9GLOM|nr:5630_t:CDS:2 [Diversispora eburnea]
MDIVINETPAKFSEKTINKARKVLKERLSGYSIPEVLVGLEEQYGELFDLLNRNVSLGESNTCILIGPTGCGKTALLKKALKSLEEIHEDDFICVYINGLFHTSDILVRQQISRQLGQQIKGLKSDGDAFDLLKSGTTGNKSILLIIYNFDMFAKNCSQPFVYNIFNIATSKNCPISVIGITRNVNVFNELAQNILSRNSHCHIDIDRLENIDLFTEVAKLVLNLNEDVIEDREYCKLFNEKIEEMFNQESFKTIIYQIFNTSTDFIRFDKLSINSPFLLLDDLKQSVMDLSVNIERVLIGLTQTQLWLLLAVNSLFFRGWTVFNFVMVYEEYTNYMKAYVRKSGSNFRMKICKEYLAFIEFEFLQSRKLIQQINEGKFQQKYNMVKSLLLPEQIIEAVIKNPHCSSAMKDWATRGLVD